MAVARCTSEWGTVKNPKPCNRQLFVYDIPLGKNFKRKHKLHLCPACDRQTLLAMGEQIK